MAHLSGISWKGGAFGWRIEGHLVGESRGSGGVLAAAAACLLVFGEGRSCRRCCGLGNLASGGSVVDAVELEDWLRRALMESDGVLRPRIGACGGCCWWRSW